MSTFFSNILNYMYGMGKTILLWFFVFIFSVVVLTFLNVAPPEFNEAGRYILNFVRGQRATIEPLGTLVTDGKNFEQIEVSSPKTNQILPVRIFIGKLGINMPVVNPQSTDTDVLDEALLEGVVRYPVSGSLLDEENIFLFGHSSFLPVVGNQSFRAFNRLKDLNIGDEIHLYSEKTDYVFKVIKLELSDENSTMIEFSSGSKKLILSTCDSFGKKTDRYVVEAEMVGSKPI